MNTALAATRSSASEAQRKRKKLLAKTKAQTELNVDPKERKALLKSLREVPDCSGAKFLAYLTEGIRQ